ncbi:MAG: ATPase V [Spirochaetales bacterium]|nr:ATPase V [Spirochaetales bacterium]
MFTSRMIHLTAVVMQNDRDNVSKVLLDHGVLDFVGISRLSAGKDKRISQLDTNVSSARIQEQLHRIEGFLSGRPVSSDNTPLLDIRNMSVPDLDSIDAALDKISSETQDLRNKQRDMQREILKLEDMQRQVAMFGDLRNGINQKSSYSFLQIQVGVVPFDFVDQFSADLLAFPSVQINLQELEGRQAVLLVTLRRDEDQITRILQKYNWLAAELPEDTGISKDAAVGDIRKKLETLRDRQKGIDGEYNGLIDQKKAWLSETWANLTMNRLLLKIQSYFSRTEKTILFSGWLPAEKREKLEPALRKACNGGCFLEWNNAEVVLSAAQEKMDIPVKLENPRFLKPFEMLVKNYATPAYRAIDPTPFVAVSYLLMFGLMFGDLGQGLVLVLLGALVLIFKKNVSENMRSLFMLIVYCGIISGVAGLLFGSVFGVPWVRPLWFNYHHIATEGAVNYGPVRNIYDVLLITIYFGIAVIGVGLVLNWINLFRSKNWLKLVFDKGGILGGWMYAAGVYTGFYFAGHSYKGLPDSLFLLVGFGIPALLLFFKEPLHRLANKKKITAGFLLMTVMEWIVELLEVFSGYLANTLSFMRVAGLGIAHASLMYAFALIAQNAAGAGNPWTFVSYLIYISGNALVIALEGLSAGIQSLRLNYYEFFSKYFNGTGKAYAPVSLKIRNQED